MTFYEELGVPPDATLESIRDAYRKVARLLHPDVQTDPALKETAESQMKRINHLYGVLSDPERRRLYDQDLAASADRPSPIFLAPAAEEQFGPSHSGTLVWLAATAVCATLIIWLASRESSSMPAVYPLQSSAGQPSGGQPVLSKPLAPPRTPAAVPPPAVASERTQPVPQHDEELAALRGKLLAANSDRERLEKQVAAHGAERNPWQPASLIPAPLVAPQRSPDIALPVVLSPATAPPVVPASTPKPPQAEVAAPVARWAGSWSYRQAPTETQDKALIPPEFIETVITEDQGRIRGQYHARFKVSDGSISPDVDFHFEGKVSGLAGHLPWTGTGGAKGEVQLRLVSAAALEIVWSATNLGKSMGLASGTAVLNRKN